MKVSKKTIELLKTAKKAMAYLSDNLGIANEEYMSGKIPHGAFNYILLRYDNAAMAIGCTNFKDGTIDPEAFDDKVPEDIEDRICKTISWMCKDLKAHIELDLNADNKKTKKDKCNKLVNKLDTVLIELGYTEIHGLLKIRIKPKQ